MLDQLVQDLRSSLRALRHSPVFSIVAILTIAIGIGANTAIFNLLDNVLLRTLPVAEPQELFLVTEVNPRERGTARLSWPAYGRLRKALPEGADLAVLAGPGRFNMTTGGPGLEPAFVQLVSGNYFSMLGVRAALGRLISEDDNRAPSGNPVAVLSYGTWSQRFGWDPGVLGRAVKLNGAAVTIVGVAEAGFFGASLGESPGLWVPLMLQHDVRYASDVASRNGDSSKPWMPQENLYWLRAIARVHRAVGRDQAETALAVAFENEQQLAFKQFGDRPDRRLILEPGSRGFTSFRERLAAPLTLLASMASLVLLIACANLANLLMARANARCREIAVRLSIGASRWRLVRQLLAESLMLGLLGGVLGLLLAVWAGPALPKLFSIPITVDADYRLVGLAAAVSLATALLFGTLPALRATRFEVNSALQQASSGLGLRSPKLLGNGLVVIQIALSLLLVTGAALLARSLNNLMSADLGFDRSHVVTVVIDPKSAGIPSQNLPDLYRRLVDRVKTIPGVADAAIAVSSIAGGGQTYSGIYVPGYTPGPSERPQTIENFVEPGYLGMMGMRLMSGRDVTKQDSANAPKVAIVNEAFTRRYFAGRDPVGLRFGYSQGHSGYEIVGMVADAKTTNVREPAAPMVFRPLEQAMQHARSLEVRTAADSRAILAPIRIAVSEVAPDLPVIEFSALADRVDRTLRQEKLLAQLTGAFALMSLLLACLGIYALLSYRVSRRTAELGIRSALGAQKLDIIRMVIGESLMLAGLGFAAGLALVFGTTRLIRALLYGLSPTDPLTLAGAIVGLLGLVVIAAYIPAHRATRVDPMVALRHE
jgi:predicted permease